MSTKITFYSTSPPEESSSKYPMQSKTSFKFSEQEGDTEINFNKAVPVSARLRQAGFSPKVAKKKVKKEHVPEDNGGDSKCDEVRKTRSGRLTKQPHRYEPVENVTDDYHDNEYDSDDSCE
tara:strand:- start:115 stop:477 length:363 start_codon:yes stop_codon:yes gene_type:complete